MIKTLTRGLWRRREFPVRYQARLMKWNSASGDVRKNMKKWSHFLGFSMFSFFHFFVNGICAAINAVLIRWYREYNNLLINHCCWLKVKNEARLETQCCLLLTNQLTTRKKSYWQWLFVSNIFSSLIRSLVNWEISIDCPDEVREIFNAFFGWPKGTNHLIHESVYIQRVTLIFFQPRLHQYWPKQHTTWSLFS